MNRVYGIVHTPFQVHDTQVQYSRTCCLCNNCIYSTLRICTCFQGMVPYGTYSGTHPTYYINTVPYHTMNIVKRQSVSREREREQLLPVSCLSFQLSFISTMSPSLGEALGFHLQYQQLVTADTKTPAKRYHYCQPRVLVETKRQEASRTKSSKQQGRGRGAAGGRGAAALVARQEEAPPEYCSSYLEQIVEESKAREQEGNKKSLRRTR